MSESFKHLQSHDMQASRREAQMHLLVSMICRKLKEQQSVAKIAEELEKSEAEIELICRIAQKYSPDYNIKRICRELLKEE